MLDLSSSLALCLELIFVAIDFRSCKRRCTGVTQLQGRFSAVYLGIFDTIGALSCGANDGGGGVNNIIWILCGVCVDASLHPFLAVSLSFLVRQHVDE